VPELLGRMRSVTDLPLVAYPNAGGVWSAETGMWAGVHGLGSVTDLLSAGARAVGGCCGTDADAIRALAEQLARTGL
jgi:homocysteine S-methyltransferase